jgi:hypothetical protein
MGGTAMMTVVTWVAVVVLGVGSLVVFAFFLRDLPKVLPKRREKSDAENGSRPISRSRESMED